jgi:hypothetical protein
MEGAAIVDLPELGGSQNYGSPLLPWWISAVIEDAHNHKTCQLSLVEIPVLRATQWGWPIIQFRIFEAGLWGGVAGPPFSWRG